MSRSKRLAVDSDVGQLPGDGLAGPSRESGGRAHRSLPLDVLRSSAVLLVLLHHVKVKWLFELPVPRWLSQAFVTGGWVGVDLFFVLSGFLISGLLFREYQRHREIRVMRFLVRRGFKIYPAFYVFLLVSGVVRYQEYGDVPVNYLYEALFIQNYLGGVWGHTWSLAVEEHFYIFLPILLLFLAHRNKGSEDPFKAIPKLCLAISSAALGLRIWNTFAYPEFDTLRHFRPTHIRIDSLMFGVFLAYLDHYHGRRFRSFCSKYFWVMIGAGLWLWIPAFVFKATESRFMYSVGFTQVFVGAGLILSAMISRGLPATRPWRVIGFFGVYSYSTYLWHLPIRKWGGGWIESLTGHPAPTGMLGLLTYVGLSLIVGVGAALLIEAPFLRIRDRLFPSRSKSLMASSPSTPGTGNERDGPR